MAYNDDMNMNNTEFVTRMIKEIVRHPDEVEVNERNTDEGRMIFLTVASPDKGLVIGRDGQNFYAYANLIMTRGLTHNSPTKLKTVLEGANDGRIKCRPFMPDEGWSWQDDEKLIEVTEWMLGQLFPPKRHFKVMLDATDRPNASAIKILADKTVHPLTSESLCRYLRNVAINRGRRLYVSISVDRAAVC